MASGAQLRPVSLRIVSGDASVTYSLLVGAANPPTLLLRLPATAYSVAATTTGLSMLRSSQVNAEIPLRSGSSERYMRLSSAALTLQTVAEIVFSYPS